MHHPNLHFALSTHHSDIGNIRGSFFANQAGAIAAVTYADEGDFRIDKTVFEISGKDKTLQQVKYLEKAYVVADGIEIGHQHKIPLWAFGFLY